MDLTYQMVDYENEELENFLQAMEVIDLYDKCIQNK